MIEDDVEDEGTQEIDRVGIVGLDVGVVGVEVELVLQRAVLVVFPLFSVIV